MPVPSLPAQAVEILDGKRPGSPFGEHARDWQLGTYLTGLRSFPVQTIDMADAPLTLVHGTPGTGQLKLTANVLFVDANSGATENLMLPPESESAGLALFVANTGGEDIIVKEDSGVTTVATISTTECAFFVCNGTAWKGGVVTIT